MNFISPNTSKNVFASGEKTSATLVERPETENATDFHVIAPRIPRQDTTLAILKDDAITNANAISTEIGKSPEPAIAKRTGTGTETGTVIGIAIENVTETAIEKESAREIEIETATETETAIGTGKGTEIETETGIDHEIAIMNASLRPMLTPRDPVPILRNGLMSDAPREEGLQTTLTSTTKMQSGGDALPHQGSTRSLAKTSTTEDEREKEVVEADDVAMADLQLQLSVQFQKS